MSDYISKSEAIHKVTEVELQDGTFAEVKMGIGELPTLDEKEIISKAFERVVERLENIEPTPWEIVKILKEECGINE